MFLPDFITQAYNRHIYTCATHRSVHLKQQGCGRNLHSCSHQKQALSFPHGEVDFWKATNRPQSHNAKDQSSLNGRGGGWKGGEGAGKKKRKPHSPNETILPPKKGNRGLSETQLPFHSGFGRNPHTLREK